jgi:hypothetical protein
MTLITRITWMKLAKVTLRNLTMETTFDSSGEYYKGSLENIQAFDLTNYQRDFKEGIIPYELIGVETGQSLLNFDF